MSINLFRLTNLAPVTTFNGQPIENSMRGHLQAEHFLTEFDQKV